MHSQFGGCDNNNTYSNSLWSYSLNTTNWNLIELPPPPNSKPMARIFHTAVQLMDSSSGSNLGPNSGLYIYGGLSSGNIVLNDIWEFDFKSSSWLPQITSDGSVQWPARYMHTAIYNQGRMITYGGLSKNNSVSPEIWQFVPEVLCNKRSCDDCLEGPTFCGWCSSESICIVGSQSSPFIAGSCQVGYFSQVTCALPLTLSPWWFVTGAIGVGVIFGLIFTIYMNFCRPEKDIYEEIKDGTGN